MLLADDVLVSRVETTPDESEIACLVVEEPLIRETRMECVGLIEGVMEAAVCAAEGHAR